MKYVTALYSILVAKAFLLTAHFKTCRVLCANSANSPTTELHSLRNLPQINLNNLQDNEYLGKHSHAYGFSYELGVSVVCYTT